MFQLIYHKGHEAFAVHFRKNLICSFGGKCFFQTVEEVGSVLSKYDLVLTSEHKIVKVKISESM